MCLGEIARSAGLTVVVTDAIETSVGGNLAVHLVAALGGAEAVGLGGAALLAGDVVPGGRAAMAPVASAGGPGLGVTACEGVEWHA
jgi:hypothetical protein